LPLFTGNQAQILLNPSIPYLSKAQTGQEENWPSCRNGKHQIEKKSREMNQKNENFNRENGNLRNSCRVKVGDVGVKGMMMLQKIGALVRDCRTGYV